MPPVATLPAEGAILDWSALFVTGETGMAVNQRDMPVGLAVSAITTIGYAGILAGPAPIGFVSHAVGLHMAFAALGVAMLLVAGSSRLLAAR